MKKNCYWVFLLLYQFNFWRYLTLFTLFYILFVINLLWKHYQSSYLRPSYFLPLPSNSFHSEKTSTVRILMTKMPVKAIKHKMTNHGQKGPSKLHPEAINFGGKPIRIIICLLVILKSFILVIVNRQKFLFRQESTLRPKNQLWNIFSMIQNKVIQIWRFQTRVG